VDVLNPDNFDDVSLTLTLFLSRFLALVIMLNGIVKYAVLSFMSTIIATINTGRAI